MSDTKKAVPKPTAHTSFDPEKDVVDLKGKVIIVTGGNAGIGFATVRHLLRAKASKVYLAARDEGRAKDAIKRLNDEGLGKEGSGSEVIWHKLDLSDPAKVKISAEEFMKREDRLDVLINNAGGVVPVDIGKEGVNNLHLVNYIGPYIFTKTLLPLLKKTAQEPDSDVRIVNVASKVHYQVPSGVQFKSLEDFNVPYRWTLWPTLIRYGNAKLAMILWSRKLQEELRPSESLPNGITVIALHPGVVDTVSFLGFIEPDVGSHTSVFAAAAKQVKEERERYQAGWGAYLTDKPVPGSVVDPSEAARDDKLKEEVVETTEKFLKNLGLDAMNNPARRFAKSFVKAHTQLQHRLKHVLVAKRRFECIEKRYADSVALLRYGKLQWAYPKKTTLFLRHRTRSLNAQMTAMASNKTTVPKPTVHKSFDPETDLVDLQGKVIIVTGANKGLGFATVRQLLIAKATKVYLAARDEGRAMEAIKLLHDEGLGKEGEGEDIRGGLHGERG
ncbi:hypothetical protein NMY22_g17784 [Coprinellus aureogranulatus]|nr:hypothetical protein NMY22_g17784 [Coprinellus aureogranulatus]